MGRRAGFPFWDLGTWERKETFAGVLTAGRIAKVAFDKAGIPAHVVYHNHANHVPPPLPLLAATVELSSVVDMGAKGGRASSCCRHPWLCPESVQVL